MYVRLFAKKSLVFQINVVVGINLLVEIWENLISVMHQVNVLMDLFCIFYEKKRFGDPSTLYTYIFFKKK